MAENNEKSPEESSEEKTLKTLGKMLVFAFYMNMSFSPNTVEKNLNEMAKILELEPDEIKKAYFYLLEEAAKLALYPANKRKEVGFKRKE